MDVAEFFAGHPAGLAAFHRVGELLEEPFDVRVSKSQVAFRRRRGFAYLWLPGRYLAKPGAEVVLSIALGHAVESKRFKEIAHPAPRTWMHHLEIQDVRELDGEVAGWLREAADQAT